MFGGVFLFALAVKYVFVKPELHYRLSQRFSRNYLLSVRREFSLVFIPEFRKKIFRDDKLQNGVSEKLQKFVILASVFVRIGRMSKAGAKKSFVFKRIAYPLFTFVHNENHTFSPLILSILSLIFPQTLIAAALYAWNIAFLNASDLDEP